MVKYCRSKSIVAVVNHLHS